VLREWAIREGIGTWAVGTISRVIADLKPKPEPKRKPRRYEIAAPMVMWSEDGTKFKDGGKKKELLVLQDENSRYKLNWELADGPANATIVTKYLREAFETNGAPLVVKHDGDSIFHDECVRQLLDEYSVVDLTSPPGYPQFNGKKERSMRDIKSYERALRKNRVGDSLENRIELTMTDLNDDRPRPVLGGMTAAEVFRQNRIRLPDRRRFKMEVETRQLELVAQAGARHEIQAARRRAIIEVLSSYELLNWGGNVSTYFQSETGTT
jgi:transposase InsO family protein